MKNILLVSTFSFLISSNCLFAAAADEADKSPTQTEGATPGTKDTVKPVGERSTPNAHRNTQQEIAKLLLNTASEVIKLTALDIEFDAYFLAADKKEPTGSVLIFPDERNHANWSVTLSPLRIGLAKHQWQTAVITLPATKFESIPKRGVYPSEAEPNTEASQSSDTDTDSQPTAQQDIQSDTDDNKTSDPEQNIADEATPELIKTNSMAELTLARAAAAREFLTKKTDAIVIIGIGQGATWAAAFAASLDTNDSEKARLFLINPQQSADVSAPQLVTLLKTLKLDTFDIYTPIRNTVINRQDPAYRRMRAANLSDIENYQQIQAPASAWTIRGNQWLFRKIRGIIKNNIESDFKALTKKQAMPVKKEKTNQMPGSSSN